MGEMLCIVITTSSLLVLLWLYAKNREKNKKDAAKVMVLSGCLGFVICMTQSSRQMVQDGKLQRNEVGGSTKSQELQLDAEGILEDYSYLVEVQAQRMQGEALEQLFDDAVKEAENVFLGENLSLDCINRDVVLPKKLQDGQIRAKWEFDSKNAINADGELKDQIAEDGELVMVSLTMHYDEQAREHTFGCYVYPKKQKPVEQLFADLKEYFEQEQEESKNSEYLRLPAQLSGRQLKWSQKEDHTYQIILMLGFAAAAAVYIQEAMREQRKEQARKEQLLKQYPDMVSKISLLLGAGMTLSSAWERIVLNYQHRLEQKHGETQEVYEQMLVAYREMQDGIGELKVYERFGDRCGTPQYRKFSMLVVQNLRKGSSGLRQSLEKEVSDAFALRKNLAKKAGEEAGTKILIPMMLMLCIVMVIILVPAFLTFQL
ncbi:MAG: hypothetical protein HFH33_02905 [Eubacterium sp.]|jgi:hypothetical protein|nr:hypothetical protein [Eubacterium sp.]